MSDDTPEKEFDITVGDDGRARMTCSMGIRFVNAQGERRDRADGILGWGYRIGAWGEGASYDSKILYVNTERRRCVELLNWTLLPPPEVIEDLVRMVREQNGIAVAPETTALPVLDRVERLRLRCERATQAYRQAVAFKAARKTLTIDYNKASPRCALCRGDPGVRYVAGTLVVDDKAPVIGSFCVACMQGIQFGHTDGFADRIAEFLGAVDKSVEDMDPSVAGICAAFATGVSAAVASDVIRRERANKKTQM